MSEGTFPGRRSGTLARMVEIGFTAALVVFAALFIWQATLVNEPPRNIIVGPRTFPLALGGMMLVVSTLLLWRTLRRKQAEPEPDASIVPLEEDEVAISDWAAVWVVLGALVALFVLLEPAGFVVSITLFLFGLSTMFSPKRWLINLIVAALFSLFFYFLFTQLLDVTLPKGLMFGHLNTDLVGHG